MLSREVAILFSADMAQVLWANMSGLYMLGVKEFATLPGTGALPQQTFIRQLAGAARQVGHDQALVRGFRIPRGTKSEFVQCELSQYPLSDGRSAILLTCDDEVLQPTVPEHEFAALIVQSLAGIADNVAIVDEFGLVVGASDGFQAIEFSADDLPVLVRDALAVGEQTTDKIVATSDNHQIGVRIINLSGQTPRLMFICERQEVLSRTSPEKPEPTQDSDIEAGLTRPTAQTPPAQSDQGSPDSSLVERDTQPTAVRSLLDRWYTRQNSLDLPTTDTDSQDNWERPSLSNEVQAEQKTPEKSEPNCQPEPQEDEIPDKDIADSSEPVAADVDSNKDQDTPIPPIETTDDVDKSGRDISETSLPEPELPFHYNATGEAIRFAWKIDADGVFRTVSPELAQTVGPNAADIIGRNWREVATVFGFDRSGEIAQMLERRDTWSGKTVMWPVQGTDLVVPIDLAALPAFDQDREFDGFRGFGIIRTADATVDYDEIGRALVGGTQPENGVPADEENDENAIEIENHDVVRKQRLSVEDETAPDDDLEIEDDDTEGNKPAIDDEPATEDARGNGATIVDMSSIRNRDREKAASTDEHLTGKEERAFQEIGEKLGSDADFEPSEDSNKVANRNVPDEQLDTPEEPDVAELASKMVSTLQKVDTEDHDIPRQCEILQQLPVPVLVYRNDELLFANNELLNITGYASLENIAAAGGIETLISARKIGEGENPVMTLTRRDGTSLRVNPLLQTVPWDDEKALLLTFRKSEAVDTVEKAAIDIVRVSELENILDTATDGIIIADQQGEIESLNASGEALFGMSFDDAKGKQLSEIFAQESQQTIEDYIAEISQPGVAGILNDGREVIGKEVNGGLIPLFVTIGKLGESEKYCVVLRDITQWKKAEEELVTAKREAENANDQKTEFLARVSHEIRTPLNAIIGFSDVMIEERFGPIGNDRYREYLRDINRSGVHVLDLINDLLDISKIEAGKMELNYEAVDLNQLVSQTVALLQPQANGERIIIRTSLSRAVPKVVADVRSVRQVILNLVSNAIKFTEPNGQVIVSTVYEGNGEVGLRVRDTGRGMSPAEIEHAMKPFSQINVMDDQRGRGTGLGLPLTKALVEANRAYFDLESKPGEGTIAHVHFPTQRVLAD